MEGGDFNPSSVCDKLAEPLFLWCDRNVVRRMDYIFSWYVYSECQSPLCPLDYQGRFRTQELEMQDGVALGETV